MLWCFLHRWIDLPKEHKLVKPSYQELTATEISSVHPSPNVLVKVICGKAEGNAGEGMVESPVRPLGGCWFFDVVSHSRAPPGELGGKKLISLNSL